MLGPVEVSGLRRRSDRRIVEELLVYLVCHDHRHLRVGQILLGMRPVGSSRGDVQEKTLRNYLSELRGCVGADHLPEATGREGYKVEGVVSDWANFQALARQADTTDKDTAIELRTQALELVRGSPFEGSLATYKWVGEEHLDTQMIVAVVRCALRLAEDLLETGHPEAAERAIRMAQKATWEDYDLWRVGARSFKVRGDRTGLQRLDGRCIPPPRTARTSPASRPSSTSLPMTLLTTRTSRRRGRRPAVIPRPAGAPCRGLRLVDPTASPSRASTGPPSGSRPPRRPDAG